MKVFYFWFVPFSFTWLACFHSSHSVKSSAIIEFGLHESTRIISSFHPASSLWSLCLTSQQQWQNVHWQHHFEVWVPFPGVTLSPQPTELEVCSLDSTQQLLLLSALNLCCGFGKRLDNRVNEQISNYILTASSPKVPSYLVKYGAIKV